MVNNLLRKPASLGTLTWLACLYLPILGLLIAAAILAQAMGIPAGEFTRDMAAIVEVHPLKGALSNLGILLWSGAASISIFSGVALWKRGESGMARFLIASGGLTLLLTLDDLFMVHEDLAKRYLGIGEKGVFLGYALLGMVYLLYSCRLIRSTHCGLFAAALVLFGGSFLVDRQKLVAGEWLFLVEDGLKLLGIASWLGYFARTSFERLAVVQKAEAVANPQERTGEPGEILQPCYPGLAPLAKSQVGAQLPSRANCKNAKP